MFLEGRPYSSLSRRSPGILVCCLLIAPNFLSLLALRHYPARRACQGEAMAQDLRSS
jgi:hypothetical protein